MVPLAKIHPLVRGCVFLGVGSLLVAMVLPLVARRGCDLSPTTSCRAWIRQLVMVCDFYAVERGTLPPEDADGGTRSLVGLLETPSGTKAGGAPYVDLHPGDLDGGAPPQLVDPWGGRLRYRIVKGRSEFSSAGPDGRFGSNDDVLSGP